MHSPDVRTGLSDVAIGELGTLRVQPPADPGGAMTAVFVVTAGSGDTYRIERVYLDREEADRFARGEL